jgi:hypothetical protein
VTVAQALHWLRVEAFYENVRRVAAPGGAIAAWCYTLPRVDARIDAVCDRFYHDVVGPYWAEGRRWIDERFETIPFPFDEVRPMPPFECRAEWTQAQYVDYLTSWSAVQRYREQRGRDPILEIQDDLSAAWGSHSHRVVTWPIHMRVGRVGRAPSNVAGTSRARKLR